MGLASKLPLLASAALLAVAAPACGRPRAPVQAQHVIELAPLTLLEAEPWVRDDCEQALKGALRRHGFLLDAGSGVGPRVDIEVAFFQYPSDYVYKADFTAHVRLPRYTQQVLASGEGNAGNLADPRPSGGGRARMHACWTGAERLAEAIAETLESAPR